MMTRATVETRRARRAGDGSRRRRRRTGDRSRCPSARPCAQLLPPPAGPTCPPRRSGSVLCRARHLPDGSDDACIGVIRRLAERRPARRRSAASVARVTSRVEPRATISAAIAAIWAGVLPKPRMTSGNPCRTRPVMVDAGKSEVFEGAGAQRLENGAFGVGGVDFAALSPARGARGARQCS